MEFCCLGCAGVQDVLIALPAICPVCFEAKGWRAILDTTGPRGLFVLSEDDRAFLKVNRITPDDEPC
jgi:hypothetical protein